MVRSGTGRDGAGAGAGPAGSLPSVITGIDTGRALSNHAARGVHRRHANRAGAMSAVQRIGHYAILRELGEGAMGVVYEGVDPASGRHVAIKTVLASQLAEQGDGSALTRFRREAETGQQLHHPNIVAVYDFGQSGPQAYIVMELVQGQLLNRLLRQRGRLPWSEALFVMQQLLDALDHSHRRGVVHRDIKPSNIMVSDGLMIKVMDFGIARTQSSLLTQIGTVLGTPSHMSPEQLGGEVVDARADLWAAGVMLYEMLTGHVPFAGRSFAAVAHSVFQTEPMPISALVPDAPAGVDAVIERALAKRREHRFQDADEFLRALEQASLTEPTSAGGLDLEIGPEPSYDLDPDATVIVRQGKP